ncbi:hypothetical protein Lfu02_61660 [Longispora fulva]|nr:hypothetical protein Lfu02_61660 [Longispora fulva]
MELHPSNSRTVYHEPTSPTTGHSAAAARDMLAEHVLDPRSGTCRMCLVPGPCSSAGSAITTLARLGVPLPGVVDVMPVDGPTLVLLTVSTPRHLVEPEPPGGLPGDHAAPAQPGVDPLDWALASRLQRDHRPDELGVCRACGMTYWCRTRRLVERVINGRRQSPQPSPEPADRLRLSAPGQRPRRVPGKAGRDYFAPPSHWSAPGWFGEAA